MGFSDKHLAWKRKTVFLPVGDMLGLSVDRLSSLGAGAAVFQEIVAAAELSGLAIGAAGDEIYSLWPIPSELDRDYPIWCRLWFTHASTDADTPDWLVDFKGITSGEALSDAGATPDETATFAATAVAATANALEIREWQKVDMHEWISTDPALLFSIECNGLGSASANEITLLGIEFAFTVKATTESGQIREHTNFDPED